MTLQLEKYWLPLKIKSKKNFKNPQSKTYFNETFWKSYVKCNFKVFALMRKKIPRCGDLYRKKKFYFKEVDAKELCFLCFSAKLLGNQPLPFLFPGLSTTRQLTSFQYHLPFPHHLPSPNTDSSLTLSHPLCRCPLPSLSCALMFSTHILVLHFTLGYLQLLHWLGNAFHLWKTISGSKSPVSCSALIPSLFCTKPLTQLFPPNRHTPYSPCFTCFWSRTFSSHLLLSLPSHTACHHALSPIPWTSLTKRSAYTLHELLMANLEIKCISKTSHTIINSEQFCLKVD